MDQQMTLLESMYLCPVHRPQAPFGILFHSFRATLLNQCQSDDLFAVWVRTWGRVWMSVSKARRTETGHSQSSLHCSHGSSSYVTCIVTRYRQSCMHGKISFLSLFFCWLADVFLYSCQNVFIRLSSSSCQRSFVLYIFKRKPGLNLSESVSLPEPGMVVKSNNFRSRSKKDRRRSWSIVLFITPG